MTAKKHILLGSLLLLTIVVPAQEKWNTMVDHVMNWPVIGIVLPTYSGETDWTFNGGLQSCFNMPNEKTPSALRVTGYYSLNKQWQIHTTGSFYMAGKTPWQLYFQARYRYYPDLSYSHGSGGEKTGIPYVSRRADLTLEPMIRLTNHWAVGPMLDLVWEKTNRGDKDSTYHGRANTLEWGLGLVTMYDTRDYKHYPTKGMMFKAFGVYYEPELGSSYRAWHLEADYRHFITLWQPETFRSDFDRVNKSLIFAYQVRSIAMLSDQPIDQMPGQIMPTLGGDELVRGLRAGKYWDNILWAVQTELRFPIVSILRGTAFVGVGDVYNTDHWIWSAPKVGYGLGLRLSVNRDHVNVRFDVARNSVDTDWSDRESYSFYLAVTEAF
ncbi:MAG: outer membrane protein assembly factor [Paludibacteraceae bacterium]|nr:outer membrane protein assembly factor [Paludibacteraceae bacterium]